MRFNRRSFMQTIGAFFALFGLGDSNMAKKSWPQAGTTVGDAVQAPYTNKYFADMFQLFFVYDRTKEGVVDTGHASYPGGLLVNAGAGFVTVQTGVGICDGMMIAYDAAFNLVPDDTPSLRTDLVVIRKTISVAPLAETNIVILKGTDGSAVPPTLTQDLTMWEVPLAEVPITPGPTIGAIVNVAQAVRSPMAAGCKFDSLLASDSTHTALNWNSLGAGLKFSIGPGRWLIFGSLTFGVNSVAPDPRGARIYNNTLAQSETQGTSPIVDNGNTCTINIPPKAILAGVVTELELQFFAGAVDDTVLGQVAPDTTRTSFTAIRIPSIGS